MAIAACQKNVKVTLSFENYPKEFMLVICFKITEVTELEPQACPANQVFKECGTACPITCNNYKNPLQLCTEECVIGCQCESGYVLNTYGTDGSCCKPEECPGNLFLSLSANQA